MAMQGTGDQLLAGAAFAGQQDGGAAVAHRVDGLQDTAKTRAFTHQAVYVLVLMIAAVTWFITNDATPISGGAEVLVGGLLTLYPPSRIGDLLASTG